MQIKKSSMKRALYTAVTLATAVVVSGAGMKWSVAPDIVGLITGMKW